MAGDAAVSNQAIADIVNETMMSWAPVTKNSHSHSSIQVTSLSCLFQAPSAS